MILDSLGACPEQAHQQTLEIAETVRISVVEPYRLAVESEKGETEWVEHSCSASIGVTLFSGQELCKSQVLRQADEAMYQAKQAGRNTIRVYSAAKL